MKRLSVIRNILLLSLCLMIFLAGTPAVFAAEADRSVLPYSEEGNITKVPELTAEVVLRGLSEEDMTSEEIREESESLEAIQEESGSSEEALVSLNEAPGIPVLNKIISLNSGLSISWKAVENADQYTVFRWQSSTASWKKIAATESLSYTDTSVKAGHTYKYTVSAVSGSTEGEYDAQGALGVYLPGVQTEAVLKGRAARLSWTNAEGADKYRVQRRVKGETSWTILGETENTEWKDTDLTASTEYEYAVRSVRMVKKTPYYGALNSTFLTSVSVPVTPAITKCVSSTTGIRIKWENVKGVKGYKLFRKTENGAWKKLANLTGTTYLDESAKQGHIYFYAVSVYYSSDYEGIFDRKGTPGVFLPAVKITSLKNASAVQVRWKPVSGADGYIILRKTAGASYRTVKFVSRSQKLATDTQVVSGKKYYYMVRAYKSYNNKKYTGAVISDNQKEIFSLFTPKPKAKPALNDMIQVSWEAIDGASVYDVFRRTGNGDYSKIKSVKGTSFHDKDIKSGTIYTYTVTAKKGSYVSNRREKGSAAAYLDMPVISSLTSEADGLLVSWNAVENASGYRVYRKGPDKKWKTLGKTGNLSFKDTAVEENVKYRYLVKAYFKTKSGYYYGAYDTAKAKAGYYISTLPYVRQLAKARLEEAGGTLRDAYIWATALTTASDQPAYKAGSASENLANYGQWSFENERGDSFGKAAVFCLMAQELGYSAKLVRGYIPMQSGAKKDHGWVEIDYNNVTYVFDPDFENETLKNGYFIRYGQSGTWKYEKDHTID